MLSGSVMLAARMCSSNTLNNSTILTSTVEDSIRTQCYNLDSALHLSAKNTPVKIYCDKFHIILNTCDQITCFLMITRHVLWSQDVQQCIKQTQSIHRMSTLFCVENFDTKTHQISTQLLCRNFQHKTSLC